MAGTPKAFSWNNAAVYPLWGKRLYPHMPFLIRSGCSRSKTSLMFVFHAVSAFSPAQPFWHAALEACLYGRATC